MSIKKRNNGFTLLEVMIAVLVLAVGLLGLAQLEVTSLKHNQSAYYRSQASNFANDIFERMRANQSSAVAGGYIFNKNKTAPASPSSILETDIAEWLIQLNKVLPNGDGFIECTDSDASDGDTCSEGSIYLVTIEWTEVQDDGDKGASSFEYRGAL